MFSSITTAAISSNIARNTQKAEALKALGLFLGTPQGFELNRTATRAEGAAMLVRLLGVEKIALSVAYTHPFNDVPDWASPYVAYLFEKGLTKGISEKKYDSDAMITTNQYTTFILRALGYDDQLGLYEWNRAIDFAGTMGLINADELERYKPIENAELLRDDVVALSFNGLFTNQYNAELNLLSRLLSDQAITTAGLEEAGKIENLFTNYIEAPVENENHTQEMKGVWISFLELQRIFATKPTKEQFQTTMDSVFENMKSLGLNTAFVHVRPYGDAIYPSGYFPWSSIITGTEGTSLSYDPLAIMVEVAHSKEILLEAWINPFRVRSASSKVPLSSGNPAATWLTDGSNRVIQNDGGIFYNPAQSDVRDLLTNGVKEIIENYDVDGIHFDDYFYPSQKMDYDLQEYQSYQTAGGLLSQVEWRRENVNLLVKQVYKAIKDYDPEIQFGISPQCSFEANYNQQYIDVKKWVSSSEYIDYICPQIYFGYQHATYPYLKTLEDWNAIVTSDTVRLVIGLAPYKIGTVDTYAKAGKYEWQEPTTIITSMVQDARKIEKYAGFAMYRYDFLFLPAASVEGRIQEEIDSLKMILK